MPSERDQDQISKESKSDHPVYHPSHNSSPLEISEKKSKNKKHEFPTPHVDVSPVDPIWQTIDPTPDVQSLFTNFDTMFFGERLRAVEVRWSPRMTLCAGRCVYEGPGGLCSIRLSEPLLKYRPRSDLVETLLHEMIHALLFVTENNRDRSAHGPNFVFHMNRINKCAKTNITIYHSFHNEVDNYKVHWWKCNGPCANLPPFYGLVRRSINRAPGPNDFWWVSHQASCPGQFIKISDPEKTKRAAKKSKKGQETTKSQGETSSQTPDIRQFLEVPPKPTEPIDKCTTPTSVSNNAEDSSAQVVPFSGVGHRLGGSSGPPTQLRLLALTNSPSHPPSFPEGNDNSPTRSLVDCPVCFRKVREDYVNEHLDDCLRAS